MAYWMTESQVRAERIRWNLAQLDDEQVAYCKKEARRLFNQAADNNWTDENGQVGTYDEWLDCIAENVRIMNDHQRGQYCAEMGEQ